ncbi:hypothetical protein, partial [Thiolapillus sp.]|uniref:hypothetical protein n=1 Tax=Thiolapillus sp. TaxID=2017437 RepID=UPI003AF5F252
MTKENDIEQRLLTKLQDLKYTCRPDIRDREALEQNFREKFEALNRINLTDAEFSRLLEGIISPDTFACAETLRHRNTFERQACLRPRDRFWDIPVPKIDSAFDNLFVPQPSWSPST